MLFYLSMGFDSKDHLDLVNRLLRSLAQRSAAVGMRIRSERELAKLLDLGRKRVAYAIGRLVKDGILIRRAGSGTFIEQLPDIKPIGDDLIACEDLLDQRRITNLASTSKRQSKRRRLAMFWSNLSDSV